MPATQPMGPPEEGDAGQDGRADERQEGGQHEHGEREAEAEEEGVGSGAHEAISHPLHRQDARETSTPGMLGCVSRAARGTGRARGRGCRRPAPAGARRARAAVVGELEPALAHDGQVDGPGASGVKLASSSSRSPACSRSRPKTWSLPVHSGSARALGVDGARGAARGDQPPQPVPQPALDRRRVVRGARPPSQSIGGRCIQRLSSRVRRVVRPARRRCAARARRPCRSAAARRGRTRPRRAAGCAAARARRASASPLSSAASSPASDAAVPLVRASPVRGSGWKRAPRANAAREVAGVEVGQEAPVQVGVLADARRRPPSVIAQPMSSWQRT